MPRIVPIGTGGSNVTGRLVNDILSTPALKDSHIALVDIDADRVALAGKLVRAIADHHHRGVRVELDDISRQRMGVGCVNQDHG